MASCGRRLPEGAPTVAGGGEVSHHGLNHGHLQPSAMVGERIPHWESTTKKSIRTHVRRFSMGFWGKLTPWIVIICDSYLLSVLAIGMNHELPPITIGS